MKGFARIIKWNIALIASLLVFTSIASGVKANEQGLESDRPKVMINNQYVQVNPYHPALLKKSRLYVPVDFFEHAQIQASVSEYYDGDLSTTSINNYQVHVSIDTFHHSYFYSYYNNDNDSFIEEEWGDAYPFLHGNKVMVPLRVVAERLGLQVKWEKQTNTALLFTDEEYQHELEPDQDWEDWIGEKTIDAEDESGEAITEEELEKYIADKDLPVVDYVIYSRYVAIALEIEGVESSLYTIERRRNGSLGTDVAMGTKEDEEGFSLHHAGDYLGIAIHESAQKHKIEYCVVKSFYGKGEVKEEKIVIGEQQGMLIKLPAVEVAGTVMFYGEDGYSHSIFFW